MVKVMILSEVADLAKWKVVFDANKEIRKAAGEVSEMVYQGAGSPNSVAILMEWENEEKLRAYNSSQALKDGREKAGVSNVGGAFLLKSLQ